MRRLRAPTLSGRGRFRVRSSGVNIGWPWVVRGRTASLVAAEQMCGSQFAWRYRVQHDPEWDGALGHWRHHVGRSGSFGSTTEGSHA